MNTMNDQDNPQYPGTDCDRLRDLLPAYALGSVDADERALVEALLVECPEVAPELAEYERVAEGLLYSAPQMEPPSSLLTNLMRETSVPEAPVAQTRTLNASAQRGIRLASGGMAAAIVLLLAVSVFSLWQMSELRQDYDVLAAQADDQRALLRDLVAETATLFELSAPDDAPDGPARTARAILLCNPMNTVGVLRAEAFPELADDGRYEVWLWRDGERTSAGILEVDATGAGMLVFSAPDVISEYEYMRVTVADPQRAAELGMPVVRGPLYKDDEPTNESWGF